MDVKQDQRIIIPMSADLVAAIEDYRYSARIPRRAEAIRQLIELGLETARARQKEVAK